MEGHNNPHSRPPWPWHHQHPPNPNFNLRNPNPNAFFPFYGFPNPNFVQQPNFGSNFTFYSAPNPSVHRPPPPPPPPKTTPTPTPPPKTTPTPPPQTTPTPTPPPRQPSQPQSREVTISMVDGAVVKARNDFLAAGETISAWKLAQAALMALKVDSWSSLGFQMQQVPSLNSIIVIEGKINAFIDCFAAIQRVTTLYDMEVEICKNEGIEKFEELNLGPLVRHPLVQQYFSLSSDATGVVKMLTSDVIFYLRSYLRKRDHVQQVDLERFLTFVAKRRKVSGKSSLGIRIQRFGALVETVRKVVSSNDVTMQDLLERKGVAQSQKKERKNGRPLFTKLKKELDERFNSISQRVESFSSVQKDFCGKHTRFTGSSSEGEQDGSFSDDDSDYAGELVKSTDRASGCPYPSANEEMARLGLKADVDPSSASGSQKLSKTSRRALTRKRAREEKLNNSARGPSKLRKINDAGFSALSLKTKNKIEKDYNMGEGEFTSADEDEYCLSAYSLQSFIEGWREKCRGVSVSKVLKRMLRYYKIGQRKKMNDIYESYPFVGVLNVAISSIKLGLWDSIYDTVQGIGQCDMAKPLISDACEYESIDIEPSTNDACVSTARIVDRAHAVSVEEIIKKVAEYLKPDHGVFTDDKSFLENRFSVLRILSKSEQWLAEQFCVKDFRSLGHGDFLLFMEKYASLLPQELNNVLTCGPSKKSPLEVCMMQYQLIILLSQASNNIWENGKITTRDVYSLLMKQFPSISFKVVADGSLNDFLSVAIKDKNSVTPKSVIFSSTLCPTVNAPESFSGTKKELESTLARCNNAQDNREHESVTSKDAIECLLKAPMLADLNLWSHWDIIFAPSLGPLVPWLLKEVKTDELLCLVTRDGKVVRIDPSATADSFLEAAIQGSSFQTAVQLLSLFSVVGGQKYVPVSLLKFHVQQAFKVISKNSLENAELNGSGNSLLNPKVSFGAKSTSELQRNSGKTNTPESSISRFILDCLHYLPPEIRVFAADMFLSGTQSIVKDAASAMLRECSQTEQLLMLHEVGLSIGVVEWINDHHTFRRNNPFESSPAETSSSKSVGSKTKSRSKQKRVGPEKLSASEEKADVCVRETRQRRKRSQVSEATDNAKASGSSQSSGLGQEDAAAAVIIESIRREEFGLDPRISTAQSSMLKKQHARLGRALHCLSQELYSQDSHFLLELVQNADDNIYPENVEPTLTFILQDSSVVVLNNEQGFSAQNIRALCDIGSSTKKGSSAGYIGQKGIGFKSVFRITDAPEIHSNGFHVKFDVSEGQIGFVLPTVVPPCDLNLYSRLASNGSDRVGFNHWNTCIVLPFRSILSEGAVMKNIMSMFSDLHPSLLLFLHRLQCIKFRNLIEDSVTVMRKEVLGDGIVNVSHGKEKMTWFVVSENLQSGFIRPDVQTTEISIAFTLQESTDGGYSPHLSQQPVFAFLPLRTYGLKFILQGNFVLPSSREEVDGSSPWNQWLLSEFPGLFVKAERSFCALSCFKDTPGKAVSAFMSFVPLVGEVHGFFASLPRMIISKLRVAKCLLCEGDNSKWVLPCKVLRGWSEQANSILPRGLLHQHLGLGFLDEHIILSDALARALGVEEYGPKILVQFLSSLCRAENGIKAMSLDWLATLLSELYSMLEYFPGRTVLDSEVESDFMNDLKSIPFIPLSNGTFSSVNEGTIWIQSDTSSSGSSEEHKIESFPKLYSKLRIVNPALLSFTPADGSHTDLMRSDKLTMVLCKIGVQRLSAHEIIKVHVLPSISDESADKNKKLMIEYFCFVMAHLHSSCHACHLEKESIMSELKNKAYILTNYGFKRPTEVSIHFGAEFGNPVDKVKLIDSLDISWHEVDVSYLKHPITKALPSGLTKWREFFQEIGVTDFVNVVQVEKTVADISHAQFKNLMPDGDPISLGCTVKDWESPELVNLLSILSRDGKKKSCEYLLEVLDKLWDSCFHDKTTGHCTSKSAESGKPFRSSFFSSISDVQWVVSTMDDKRHFPRDLYYDCDAVRSVLGASAPYALPKVKNEKFVSDIGFKTIVSLGDVLAMLKEWTKGPFMESVTQMSKLYTFIWNEMATSKNSVQELQSGPFVFVPYATGSRLENVVSGVFLPPCEVYWSDSTGAMDLIKEKTKSSKGGAESPSNKTLCNIYPGLHDFFVNVCGVHENPPLTAYLEILLQLSSVALPSQVSKTVFQVLLKWTDALKSGLSPEDVAFLQKSLKKSKYTVLPTKQGKWVSLHRSFGLVCWIDDAKLKNQFKKVKGIDFLYLGKLSKKENEMLRTKVSVLMSTLGVPSLSEVVSREAIHYGVTDSSFKTSLVNWALPYIQRYLNSMHSDKYAQLKQSGFDTQKCLQVVVVDQLFYRNVIKTCGSKSDKRIECSCILQDNILYTTQESDPHDLFLELSRLFFPKNPDLHIANFLHMITTMAESGSNEDQTEIFILNCQKIPKLPDGESVWSLSPVSQTSLASSSANDQSSSKSQKPASNWPPPDWKTAPGFGYARAHGYRTRAAPNHNEYDFHNIDQIDNSAEQISIKGDWTIEDDSGAQSTPIALPYSGDTDKPCSAGFDAFYEADRDLTEGFNPIGLETAAEVSGLGPTAPYDKGHVKIVTPDSRAQAMMTGVVGEHLAFKYFLGKAGNGSNVTWVNRDKETGLPYDIVISDERNGTEYIEVKSTISRRKNWLMISSREWQFAAEKRDAFSIAHVVLTRNNVARVSVFKNPAHLLEQKKLRLVVVMPMEQEFATVS